MSFDTNKRKVQKLYEIVNSNEYTINGLHKDEIRFNSRAFQKKHITIPIEFTEHPIQPVEASIWEEQLYSQFVFDNLSERILPFIKVLVIAEKEPAWSISNPEYMDLDNIGAIPSLSYRFEYIWRVSDKEDILGNIVGSVIVLDLYLIYRSTGFTGGRPKFNLELDFLNENTYNDIPNHKE